MQGAQELQDGDHSRCAVDPSRPTRGGVIVSYQQNGTFGISARKADEDVLNRTTNDPAGAHNAHPNSILHLRFQAEFAGQA